MHAYVRQQSQQHGHQHRPWPRHPVYVRNQKAKQRKEHVAARHHRKLIRQKKCKRQHRPQIERKRRQPQQHIDSCRSNPRRDPSQRRISHTQVRRHPQNQIPQPWVPLVAQVVHQKLRNAQIPRQQPSLSLIPPRLMPGNDRRQHRTIAHPHGQIANFQAQHTGKCSSLISREPPCNPCSNPTAPLS